MTGAPERVSERRRLAALGALVGTAALVGFVVGALFRHGSDILIGLVGLAVAATGAWWVVTERLPRRAIGAAGVLAGIAVVAVAVAECSVRATRSPSASGSRCCPLLGVTMACARAAMRRGPPPPRSRADARMARRVRAVLLCNPWSGDGHGREVRAARARCRTGRRDGDARTGPGPRGAGPGRWPAGADCLGVAGGDGSQAVVAAVAVEHGIPFVCVSAGTRNHFALDLGLDRDDPRQLM